MVDRTTQGKLERFQGALNNHKIDWPLFAQLEDQQANAMQLMINNNILTKEKFGHYEVQAGMKGILSFTRNLEHGVERDPLYFKKEEDAKKLLDFYKTISPGATLTKHDRQEQ